MPLLHPAPTTRHREIDGLVVILDLRTGDYITLNRTASAMWQGLLGDRGAALVASLAGALGAAEERVAADLDGFRCSCLERGLLVESAPAVVPPPLAAAPTWRARGGLLAARAWAALLTTSRSLSRHGFVTTYQGYARLPRPPVGARSDRLLADAERAFARAEIGFVMRSAPEDCLPRSLALWRFLVSVGVPAEHCIGVRRYPFGAHAWTEAGGRVLFDSPARTGEYAEIARM